MLKKFVRIFGGDPNKREIDKYTAIVEQINELEPQIEALSNEALKAKTAEFRARLDEGETLDDLLPEAFATVREASKRSIGLRHFDVQLIGGIALHQGRISEMRTGEGKTLVATLPLYLNALTGRGVHLITVNDYLARRDARWMAPIYNSLGLSVGVLQMAARTENGKKAFLVDLERESPHEDQNQLQMVPRREAYTADILYGTNSEFGFDYLRDNMSMSMEERVQRDHYYAIVDEVDNVLIDEARTPLIISGPAQDDAEWYIKMAQIVKGLRPEDYEISEKDHTVTLTELGEVHVEELLGMALRDPDRPEDVTPEQARLLGYLEQALRAQYLFRRNKDYLVQAGKVVIIDEFTGRLMPGRRWSDGLHQAVEAKENQKVQSESVTYATITIQNYFRMYDKLAGMTGTAVTEAEEFDKIYKLEVLAIPTNLEYQAKRDDMPLVELEDRDEQGYKYQFYAYQDDPEHKPIYWRRKDYPDVVYRTEEAKLRAIAQEILFYHVQGRPLLVGTTSVELSERVSTRLRAEPLRRLAQVLLLRRSWMNKNNREEDGRLIQELEYMYAPLDKLDVTEMRKMARDLDLAFNPEEPANLQSLLSILGLAPAYKDRLAAALQAGIAHEVLNARKHTEESQIIAGAGSFGAVTIATNMAGRGVDIKLGGELAEEVHAAVNRVIHRAAKFGNPYEMTMEERRQAIESMQPSEYGIYDAEVKFFLQHMQDMEQVRSLGGLHVIGSERHEARRIDNQLRGRAARQGDPGSSRFYLSMEDELMRLFGGGQADNLMQRMRIDDALPLEVGVVSRLVEQSQTRVEGANFDVRKHLLEYDDVLNTQRSMIYSQRNRIFTKEDLSEDVGEMLRAEVMRRIPQDLADDEGHWKLLSWLDQIQPPFQIDRKIFPSYTLRLLVDRMAGSDPHDEDDVDSEERTFSKEEALRALLDLAAESIKAEEEHLLQTTNDLLNLAQDRLENQLKERMEMLDTFFEGLELEDDEAPARKPADLLAELTALVHLPLRLSPEQQRLLVNEPDEAIEEVRDQVEIGLFSQSITRLVGSVERRLEESLELNAAELAEKDWDEIAEEVLSAVEQVFQRRRERYLGSDDSPGQIRRDLEGALERLNGPVTTMYMYYLLGIMPQGARAGFDKKTHRRIWRQTTRLTYLYHAAQFLRNRELTEVAEDVLEHLQEAQATMRRGWGRAELSRQANASLRELPEPTRNSLASALGEARFEQIAGQPLQSLAGEEREAVVDRLGSQTLTDIYRQLILRVVTDLWVDYLTQMEALRVSIGLEAYAQRDPLVQYKNRAFELFQNLLSDMRMGVVTRMFTYRPRETSAPQAAASTRVEAAVQAQAQSSAGAQPVEVAAGDGGSLAIEEQDQEEAVPAPSAAPSDAPDGPGSKKRRRRRR